MAKQPVMTAALAALVEEFTLRARQVVYGAEGAPELGTLFTEIEDIGCHDIGLPSRLSDRIAAFAAHHRLAVEQCHAHVRPARCEPLCHGRHQCAIAGAQIGGWLRDFPVNYAGMTIFLDAIIEPLRTATKLT